MSRATHGASTRWLWSAHQSFHPQNSLQKLVIRTRFCSHSLVEELLQSDSEVALRHAVASDCDEFVSGESALDLRGTEQSGVTVKTTTSTNTEHLRSKYLTCCGSCGS